MLQEIEEDIESADVLLLPGPEVFQESSSSRCDYTIETVDFELDILGRTANFRIDITQEQVELADIVPLARTLSTKLTLIVLDRLRENGKIVSCRKGCSACCSYLIPLSVPEVFRLRKELLAMPTERATVVLESCFEAAKTILSKRLERFDAEGLAGNQQSQIDRLSKWYTELKLACPFLLDDLCTMYEQRPLACREHIVTGSLVSCKAEEAGEPEVVRMPVSVIEALAQLTAVLESSNVESVMLPLAAPWVQNNIQRSKRTWPAVIMAEQFVTILKTMASKNAAGIADRTLLPATIDRIIRIGS